MLNDKQQRFCEEYVVDFNATQAAIRAGYSEDSAGQQAHDLLKKHEIQGRITQLKQQIADKAEVNASYITEKLITITERCMQGEPVKDKEGNETGEWKFDANAANKSLELLGKRIGYFEQDNRQKGIRIKVNTPNE